VAAERWDEQVGSVADEAARLLESLRRSAAEAADAATGGHDAADVPAGTAGGAGGAGTAGTAGGDDATPPGPEAHAHTSPGGNGEHDPVCQWCPICRGAAVVRSLSPETLTRLADLASLAAGLLSDLAVARGTPAASAPDGDAPATPRRPAPAVSRPIPVRDADGAPEGHRG
jgi:hypothetical protein